MTPAERVAAALGERFDVLDSAAMGEHPAFRCAVADALALVGDEDAVVAQVVRLGPLTGSHDPHRVVVSRLRRVPGLAATRRRIAEELAEERRWAAVDTAARRGETLRALVERGALFPDEAVDVLRRELVDPDLSAVALAALTGGRS
jgi:hypothetical protein